jgi:hypothetical protein
MGYIVNAVERQRSNQLNYVPGLFSYPYRKTAYLLGFLRFNRSPASPLSTPYNQIPLTDTMDTKLNPRPETVSRANTNPEQLSLPRE